MPCKSVAGKKNKGTLLKLIIRDHINFPTKPRSNRKRETKKVKERKKRRLSVQLDPETLHRKIANLKYSRDYSFLFTADYCKPALRKWPPPPPVMDKKKKTPTTTASTTVAGNAASAAIVRADHREYPIPWHSNNNKQPVRDRDRDRSSREATEEDMKALRWLKEIERRQRVTK